MSLEYLGLKEITGPLIVIDGVDNASYEEMVTISVGQEKRLGRIIQIEGKKIGRAHV